MTTPAVWTDAKARITAAAASLTLPVQWPNERFDPATSAVDAAANPLPFLAVETQATSGDPIELAGGVWQEDGMIWLHVMIPTDTGIDAGLALRKALSNAFRGIADAPDGLVYRDGQGFDPAGPTTDDGAYRPLSMFVRYIYQDRPA